MRMKLMKIWMGITAGCLLYVTGCDDFFEKDLTGKRVNLIAPGDSIVTTVTRQLFLWEELDGATAYRLVVMVPDFRQSGVCLLDTLVNDHRYEYELPEGIYTWGIQAENSAWKSAFSSRILIVRPQPEKP